MDYPNKVFIHRFMGLTDAKDLYNSFYGNKYNTSYTDPFHKCEFAQLIGEPYYDKYNNYISFEKVSVWERYEMPSNGYDIFLVCINRDLYFDCAINRKTKEKYTHKELNSTSLYLDEDGSIILSVKSRTKNYSISCIEDLIYLELSVIDFAKHYGLSSSSDLIKMLSKYLGCNCKKNGEKIVLYTDDKAMSIDINFPLVLGSILSSIEKYKKIFHLYGCDVAKENTFPGYIAWEKNNSRIKQKDLSQ